MKLKLNREYAARHLFVTFVMLSLFCWFGFDAVVRYPATDPKVLYVSIEGAEPPANFDLESFKAQKTKTQYGFSLATLIVALVVGLRLLNAWHLDFAFDDDGFSYNGRRFAYGDIKNLTLTRWKKLGILAFSVVIDGANHRIVLDSWHHEGVKDFFAQLQKSSSLPLTQAGQ